METDQKTEVAAPTAAAPETAAQGETEMPKTATTAARASKAKPKLKTAKKAPKAPKAQKTVFATVPKLADLRLAPNGIRMEKNNRYVNIVFTNGFSIRLFPVGFPKAQVRQTSELVVELLNR
jgi:hypothetical protein